MAERALRGTRLGATSYENDRNTDLAPRQEVAFDCPKGHHFSVPFAAEAELPAYLGVSHLRCDRPPATGDLPSPKKVKPPRSHWDMLMERRTVEDLEAVLAERLEVIRGTRRISGSDRRRTPPQQQPRLSRRERLTPRRGPCVASAAAGPPGDAPLRRPARTPR